jgi:hypothetical protein
MKMFSAHQRPLLLLQGILLPAFLAGGIFLLGGCGQKSSAPETSATSQNSNSAAEQVPANSPAVAAGNGPRTVPVTVPENTDAAAKLDLLTQLVRRFSVEHRQVPQSLNELVAAGYLAALPPAPPGKQFAIDGKHVQVVLK